MAIWTFYTHKCKPKNSEKWQSENKNKVTVPMVSLPAGLSGTPSSPTQQYITSHILAFSTQVTEQNNVIILLYQYNEKTDYHKINQTSFNLAKPDFNLVVPSDN